MFFSDQTKDISRKTIHISSLPNCLGQNNQYEIDIRTPIHEYSSELTTAYKILQTNQSNSKLQLYNIASEAPYAVDMSKLMLLSKHSKINNFTNIVEIGISRLNDTEHISVIFKYPPHTHLLKNHTSRFSNNTEAVVEIVIIPLLEVLIELHNLNIVHGCINANNIWVDAENNMQFVALSNPCLEPCGYNQINIFETVERALTHKSGKNANDTAVDCYAVGVLLLSLLSGRSNVPMITNEIAMQKARHTSYEYFMEQWFSCSDIYLTEYIKQFTYWLLHDNPQYRWDAVTALKFLNNRNKNAILHNAELKRNEDLIRQKHLRINNALVFSGEPAHYMTEAAVSAWKNYDDIKSNVQNGKLIHSLLHNEDISAGFILKISELRKQATTLTSTNHYFQRSEIFLALFILLLNKHMPLKLRDISVDISAIWNMLAYVVNRNTIQFSYTLQNLLHNGFLDKIHDALHSISSTTNKYIVHVQNMTKIIEELSQYYDVYAISYFAMGYMIPSIIYQGNALGNILCIHSTDIIETMDGMNSKQFDDSMRNSDTICMAAGKLMGSYKDVQLFLDLPTPLQHLQHDKDIHALYIFSEIQNRDLKKPLRNLAEMLSERISNKVLSSIRNLKCREKMKAKLKKATNSGYLRKMVCILQSKDLQLKHKRYLRAIARLDLLSKKAAAYDSMSGANIDAITQAITLKIVGSIFIVTLLSVTYSLLT